MDIGIAEMLRRINNCDEILLDLSKSHTLDFEKLLEKCNIAPLKMSEVFDFLMEDGLKVQKKHYEFYDPRKEIKKSDPHSKQLLKWVLEDESKI